MGRPLVKLLLLWVFIVLVQNHGGLLEGCLEEERIGLLKLKDLFNLNKSDDGTSHLFLPSWVDERESECCHWERVSCNHTTGRVVELQLDRLTLNNSNWFDHHQFYPYCLNFSLFKPFEELLRLDISFNFFHCYVENEDYQTLSKLSKLVHLDLSYNNFNKDILKSLSNLSVLKFLSVKGNQMEGPFSNKELENLYNLEVLILGRNQLNGTLPNQDLISFNNLEVLDLSNNMFTGNIPPHIGELTSLKALSLAWNKLNNTFFVQGLCKLRNLQELDLSVNSFEGILPPCLSNLRSLRVLDLSSNQFKGDISFIISNLTSLEYINLNYNDFEGLFSFSSLANHSKLEVVELISDNNKMEVETNHYSNWTPKFQLKVLMLPNCNLNKLTREIPKFLLHQYNLRELDLSHNNLTGVFPYWLLNNNARLEVLNLRNNSLTGQFDLPPSLNNSISWMDVSDNHFHGQLQETISRRLPYISYLNLARNSFEGLLPSSLCSMSDLDYLDLSVNMFSGEVPKELVSGCINLSILKLSRNKFHGQILSTHFNLSRLEVLQLDDNQFSGILSNTILKNKDLSFFDISSNYFSGVIPNWISNMTGVSLIMRNNSFKGRLPSELVAFSLFDVSHNSLSGSLPSWSNQTYHIYLQANKFTGPIPIAFVNSSSLLTLDFRDNHLSGNIPNGISALSNLRVLLLRGNHLDGLIPNQLCKLNNITLLDLANNFFSGSIPSCISNITFGNTGPNDQDFKSLFTQRYGWENNHEYDTYGSLLLRKSEIFNDPEEEDDVLVEAKFVTKRRSNSYEGDILYIMSGLDFSCNNLTGEIPHELGELVWIHSLNLSHNQLKGSIPRTFSSLTQIESLDLSYNKLSGVIPMELVDLNFLAVFSVAHNNLSGKIPRQEQFGTFDESSYEGNRYLCGAPLEKNCTTIVQSPNSPTTFSKESETKWYEIIPEAFYVTFSVSYIIFLLALASVLAINPYWRRRWFNFIEEHMYSSYYFVYDVFYKLLAG